MTTVGNGTPYVSARAGEDVCSGRRSLRIMRPSGSAPPPAFSPKSIADCIVWLRSDLGITIDGSNRVTGWLDQVAGTPYSLVTDGPLAGQVTLPTWAPDGGPNGVASVFFNVFDAPIGTDGLQGASPFQVGQDRTVVIVGHITADANAGTACTVSFHAPDQQIMYSRQGATYVLWDGGGGWDTTDPFISGDVIFVYRIAGDGSTARVEVNGVEQTLGSAGPITTEAAEDFFFLGFDALGDGNPPWDGQIDDLFAYSRLLTDAEVADLYSQYTQPRYLLPS